MCHSKYLIIGADSLIARGVAKILNEKGACVLKTTRRKNELCDSCFYLDLSEDVSGWHVPEDVKTAFLCAAVTSIDQCRHNPSQSRLVNVENALIITSKLSANGIKIVYPSTNMVFDGMQTYPKISDFVNPCTEYGRQKAQAEQKIMQLDKSHSIIRFTKVISKQMPLIQKWISDLQNNREVHPFSNMFLSPISIDFAAEVMIKIADYEKGGIWHVGGQAEITYEQFARYIADKLGFASKYIKPVKIEDSGIAFEYVARHTILDTSRLYEELNIEPPHIWQSIDRTLNL